MRPSADIIDYNTAYSGISEAQLSGVTRRLRDVHADLRARRIITPQTLLVGHSVDSDFKALRMVHRRVLDTSWLYLFSHVPDGPSGAYPHLAHHASEIPFVFHDLSATGPNADKFHISAREVEPVLR